MDTNYVLCRLLLYTLYMFYACGPFVFVCVRMITVASLKLIQFSWLICELFTFQGYTERTTRDFD